MCHVAAALLKSGTCQCGTIELYLATGRIIGATRDHVQKCAFSAACLGIVLIYYCLIFALNLFEEAFLVNNFPSNYSFALFTFGAQYCHYFATVHGQTDALQD